MFCGSVEHLKRDCPRKVEKDVKQGVRVGVMGDTGLEDERFSWKGSFESTLASDSRTRLSIEAKR